MTCKYAQNIAKAYDEYIREANPNIIGERDYDLALKRYNQKVDREWRLYAKERKQ